MNKIRSKDYLFHNRLEKFRDEKSQSPIKGTYQNDYSYGVSKIEYFLNLLLMELVMPLTSGENISDIINQGMGPNPIRKDLF